MQPMQPPRSSSPPPVSRPRTAPRALFIARMLDRPTVPRAASVGSIFIKRHHSAQLTPASGWLSLWSAKPVFRGAAPWWRRGPWRAQHTARTPALQAPPSAPLLLIISAHSTGRQASLRRAYPCCSPSSRNTARAVLVLALVSCTHTSCSTRRRELPAPSVTWSSVALGGLIH